MVAAFLLDQGRRREEAQSKHGNQREDGSAHSNLLMWVAGVYSRKDDIANPWWSGKEDGWVSSNDRQLYVVSGFSRTGKVRLKADTTYYVRLFSQALGLELLG
jgi:hypothetical protein